LTPQVRSFLHSEKVTYIIWHALLSQAKTKEGKKSSASEGHGDSHDLRPDLCKAKISREKE